MDIQERYNQNKRCYQRIKELEKERQELESLIAENLIQIYDAMQHTNGKFTPFKSLPDLNPHPKHHTNHLLLNYLHLPFLHRGRQRGTFCPFSLKYLAITAKQRYNLLIRNQKVVCCYLYVIHPVRKYTFFISHTIRTFFENKQQKIRTYANYAVVWVLMLFFY